MVILYSTMTALVLWVVLWSLGAKSFDAFMLSMAIIVGAATWHVVAPYLPGRHGSDEAHPDPAPFT